MKKYGIYLAYPPGIDLRAEGLGMHLSEFLKGAQTRGEVKFIIACPSWMRKSLIELFDASGVNHDYFEILSPETMPPILVLYEFIVKLLKKSNSSNRKIFGLNAFLLDYTKKYSDLLAKKIVSTRSFLLLIIYGLFLFPVLLILLLIRYLHVIFLFITFFIRKIFKWLNKKSIKFNDKSNIVSVLTTQPKESSFAVNLYHMMEVSEANLMHRLIETRNDVVAWYCPTAFWPQFNLIRAPKLTCVPDVVLTDFPVGFAQVGGNRFLDTFKKVEQSIKGGQYFITYSEDVKKRTLVERYHIDSKLIFVVPHGVNRLDSLVKVTGFPDNDAATDSLCRKLLSTALGKAIVSPANIQPNLDKPANLSISSDVKFIFYASQLRPNKNVISLLKAYDNLLKRRFVVHKLVLTGNPTIQPEVARFVKERNLENDVLFLHKLSQQELAACYRLADLAVNPSMSEGGCPFTFSEALSVGTPVVMARIPVTEEVITDVDLQQSMLFDPYDWKDMADKIYFGLLNRQRLLEIQLPLYEKLSQRTWKNVVDEYINALEVISSKS